MKANEPTVSELNPSHGHDQIRAIQWQGDHLVLLDQRLLPQQVRYLECNDVASVSDAIHQMVVRGAPAIGIAAAYGVVMAARDRYRAASVTWKEDIQAELAQLAAARPTAVNLVWAIERMKEHMASIEGDPVEVLLDEAQRIHAEDIAANRAMGRMGAELIAEGSGVLTHCNTGSLATGGFGTALGVIRQAYGESRLAAVFADETRPWLQGSRLTAWELMQDAIPARVIADSAAASLMRSGQVQWVIVGADRVAANGDVVNKIGTYSLAVLARQHGVQFMVVAPSSTVDMNLESGEAVPIEQRDGDELLSMDGRRLAPAEAQAWNPVFDMTPAALVDVLITERGVVRQPDPEKVLAMMQNA
jgi:methylthioribose-1-phosphate isomerase